MCKLCNSHVSRGIRIDPKTYEVIAELSTEPVKLLKRYAEANRTFWEIAERRDALKLNFNIEQRAGESRYYPYYFDIPALLGDESFRAEVDAQIRRMTVPNAVIVPKHSNSQCIVDLIMKWHKDASLIIWNGERFEIEDKTILSRLKKGDCILIADDSIITGSTLKKMKEHLHHTLKQDVSFQIFVVLARPDSDDVIKELARRYRGGNPSQDNIVKWGHKILVPPKGDSPWTAEKDRLSRCLKAVPKAHESIIKNRLRQLEVEIGDNAVFGFSIKEDYRTNNSFFGSLLPKYAFSACASACQQLKQDNKIGERGSWQGKEPLFDIAWALTTYYDGPLVGSFLRFFRQTETFARQREDIICEKIRELIGRQSSVSIVEELLFAVVDQKLPKPVADIVIKSEAGKTHVAKMLYSVLQRRRTNWTKSGRFII